MYFSFATLCTVSYGDIVPVSNLARMLAVLEAIVGMFYMTMLVARLVTLYCSEHGPLMPETAMPAAYKRKNE
jgi:hypothetical protein